MFDPRIPLELQEAVELELEPGERIEWMATPDAASFARPTLPAVLFGIPWTAFAVFWVCGAAGFKWPDFRGGFDFFPLFGIPFVLVGVGLLTSPLWSRGKARRTVYAITDRRVIAIHRGRSTTIRSFLPIELRSIVRRERPNGRGDVLFGLPVGTEAGNVRQYYLGPWQLTDFASPLGQVGLLGIEQARDVERLVRSLAQSAGAVPAE